MGKASTEPLISRPAESSLDCDLVEKDVRPARPTAPARWNQLRLRRAPDLRAEPLDWIIRGLVPFDRFQEGRKTA